MILTAALNNALQAGSTEVVASSVIISEVIPVDQDSDAVSIDTDIDLIAIEVSNV